MEKGKWADARDKAVDKAGDKIKHQTTFRSHLFEIFAKIFEKKMIQNRLPYYLKTNNAISEKQFVFTKNTVIQKAFNPIRNIILDNLVKIVPFTFFDLAKAYS